jgi:ACT domain-containing protein
MLEVKRIKPVGCQVLVTKNVYGWDDFNESGILIHSRGDLKTYQTVIAVGDDVKFVKPGDVVEINLYKYCEFQDDPNSIKVNGTNKVVSLHLNIVEMVDKNNEPVDCFLIDQRDVKYILKEFKEVTYKEKELIIVKQPKQQLILPDNKIKA